MTTQQSLKWVEEMGEKEVELDKQIQERTWDTETTEWKNILEEKITVAHAQLSSVWS